VITANPGVKRYALGDNERPCNGTLTVICHARAAVAVTPLDKVRRRVNARGISHRARAVEELAPRRGSPLGGGRRGVRSDEPQVRALGTVDDAGKA